MTTTKTKTAPTDLEAAHKRTIDKATKRYAELVHKMADGRATDKETTEALELMPLAHRAEWLAQESHDQKLHTVRADVQAIVEDRQYAQAAANAGTPAKAAGEAAERVVALEAEIAALQDRHAEALDSFNSAIEAYSAAEQAETRARANRADHQHLLDPEADLPELAATLPEPAAQLRARLQAEALARRSGGPDLFSHGANFDRVTAEREAAEADADPRNKLTPQAPAQGFSGGKPRVGVPNLAAALG